MKYSIRGTIPTDDGTEIVQVINRYSLWRLVTSQDEAFTFEAWVNTEADRTSLFEELKPYAGVIDWHECTHDEADSQPCVIAEEYRG
ncbi:MAG: hypothetical protein ACQEV7_07845 [Bacillota bacterium]